ncbi:TadE family protein [Nocardioides sp.]|jgi:Flp pilus assembly protein TadG|uniref:TadE/TadG family type IV pilus assembly protein n=1 Tax=Nocardioides sp. TaxID=35761 RepID=UPI002C39B248|nr:TadE family protein [Nocardioides sp.]HVX53552.1 TadE family protein [Nocardioides sp.]
MGNLRRCDRGAAAVEFAIVVPLLCLLIFGIVAYGMMLSFRQNLSQAAAEGARAAAVAPKSPPNPSYGPTAQAAAAIANALGSDYSCSNGNLFKGTTQVGGCTISPSSACTAASTPDPPTSAAPCTYTVTLSYDYKSHPAIPNPPLVPIPGVITYVSAAQGNS